MSDCNNNCPEKTSDITLFDGTFNNITVPDGSSLNDVLALLETYFTNQINGIETSYTLESDSACLGLTAGTYSLQQMVQAIILKVCENADSIQDILNQIGGITLDVNTTDVELDGIVGTPCSTGPGGFVGTTSTDLFNYILDELCGLEEGVNFDPVTDDVNSATEAAVNYKAMSEVVRGMVDNDYIISQTTPVTNPASFASSIGPISAIIDGYYVNKTGGTIVSLAPNRDKYYSLGADGSLNSQEGANGFPYTLPPGDLLLYKFVSDGSGITGVTVEGGFDAFNPTPLGVDDVDTVNIRDGAVTSVKLDDVVVGDTKGSSAIIEITYNNKGQITNVTSNLNIGAISNGQGIAYNAGTLAFEPVDLASANPTPNYLPISDGSNFFDSPIRKDSGTGQTVIESSFNVQDGVAATDPNAAAEINSVSKYFKPPRMLATEASAISPVEDGAMVYVTTTDPTFTAVGFWGYENGAWVKL